jgi:2-oxoglutarate ferredoxin oxidoreductase subunit beta
MEKQSFNIENIDIAWCPGCGNFGIRNVLMQSLADLDIDPQSTVIVSGIGQAAKLPHYLTTNMFNGLHGRALSNAVAIKAVNPKLQVILTSGDGDMYGEGGNHFIHNIRRNPDITCFIHNNMVYGLTKGQASPTSQPGFHTPVQVNGVFIEPFNPLAVSIALDASFVARAFIGDLEQTKDIFKQAIRHKGFSIVDIFQPCVTFNKLNSYQWFKENTYYLDDKHDPYDKYMAFEKAMQKEKLPLGVFYMNTGRKTFEESLNVYQNNDTPIFKRKRNTRKLQKLINLF